jgi:hypothetical protein
MKRGLALGILIAIGSLSMMVSGFQGTSDRVTQMAIRLSCSRRSAPCTPATCSPGRRCRTIDTANGGSVLVHPQTLAKAVAAIKNVDTVIPGHMQVVPWNDFKEFADFTQDFVTFARNEIKAGKTVDQAAK